MEGRAKKHLNDLPYNLQDLVYLRATRRPSLWKKVMLMALYTVLSTVAQPHPEKKGRFTSCPRTGLWAPCGPRFVVDLSFLRDGETTIKIKFSLFEGGGALGAERKVGQNAFFSWEKCHDNEILKVQILLSRTLVVIAQAPIFNLSTKRAEFTKEGWVYKSVRGRYANRPLF